ncbi:MAG: CADD family putative folate metabolism protein [Candidatus Marinimicrobia bacterium]|nr:CADD family putative folate metabolism protein [Candidatus Neomarinimicrobiota bacterium]
MNDTKLLADIDQEIMERDLLKHPFYQAWSEGALSIESLRGYAIQYYQFVNMFPRLLSAVHSNCEDLVTRQSILENLAEEENFEKPHPVLWLNFAKALSLSTEEITNSKSLEETEKAMEILTDICRNRHYLAGSAALYAYESRVPEIAGIKIDGLKKYYGIDGEKGLEYFTLHKEVDILHAEIWRNVISSEELSEDVRNEIMDSVREAMSAYNMILDGVQREYASA